MRKVVKRRFRVTFVFRLTFVFRASADPERPGAMAETKALGSIAGATRNAAATSGIINLRDIKFLPSTHYR
jgi:hypothetical protein